MSGVLEDNQKAFLRHIVLEAGIVGIWAYIFRSLEDVSANFHSYILGSKSRVRIIDTFNGDEEIDCCRENFQSTESRI